MEKIEKIGYRILNLRTNQYATFNMPSETGLNMSNLSLNNSFSYGIAPSERVFTCKLEIIVRYEDSLILKIETQATYLLHEDYFKELIENCEFRMSELEVQYFTRILYGATRGILLCKLEDTTLRNFILPPINLHQIITHPLLITFDGNGFACG